MTRPKPPVPPDSIRKLSPSERRVLALIADGFTDGEIAEQLHISPRTSITHAYNIRHKLGARNRPHSVALYYRRNGDV